MNPVPYMMTDNSITVVLNSKAHTFTVGDASFNPVKDAIKRGDWDALPNLVDKGAAIENFSAGKVTVNHGQVFYAGEAVNGVVVDRILQFMSEQLPFEPLVKFLERLMLNPSKTCVDQLYQFLENKSLPITPNGTFLAYKAVEHNFMSKTSGKNGKVFNGIGTIVQVPRREVDDNRANECSYGLHAGALEYVKGFGSGDDKFLVVEIDPADVVAVPADHSFQKLRTCKYKVVGLLQNELNESASYEVVGTQAVPLKKGAKRDAQGRFTSAGAKDMAEQMFRDSDGKFAGI